VQVGGGPGDEQRLPDAHLPVEMTGYTSEVLITDQQDEPALIATPDVGSGNRRIITDSVIRGDGIRLVWLINTVGTGQPASRSWSAGRMTRCCTTCSPVSPSLRRLCSRPTACS
jgi:hypothetical protein